jgi:hypothetical protein
MRGREEMQITVVAVAVVAVLAGLLVFAARSGLIGGGPAVVLLGDSITAMSDAVFEERLGDDWAVTTSGVPGAQAEQRLPNVPELAELSPTQVVVNLGTNDVMGHRPPGETVAALDQLGRGFPEARCIHLVTINRHMASTTDPGLPARIDELNAGIRGLAATRRWGIVPWDELVADYDAGPQPFGPITTDTVHPTLLGQRMLAEAYRRALQSCPA